MSPTTSVVFDPEIPDRELDREASKVDKRLAESGQIQPEIGDVEGDLGMGDLGGGGMGGRRGGGMPGMGGAGAAGGVASRIPKPIAGVTASAAMPVALAGGVGIGLLGAMHSASARLQTQTKLIGIAVDNFFREPGNVLAETISPFVDEFTDISFDFDQMAREKGLGVATIVASDRLKQLYGDIVGGQVGAVLGDTIGTSVGDALGNISLSRALAGGPSALASEFGNQLGQEFGQTMSQKLKTLKLPAQIRTFEWPSFPSLPEPPADYWPSFPSLPDPGPDFWPDLPELPEFPDSSGNRTNSDTGGAGGGLLGPLLPHGPLIPPVATGGRVADSGVARVHKDEIIAPEDRLVDELSAAINQQSGGGGTADVDTSAVENKLDKLNRNITQLAQAMQSMNIEVDKETLGRMASEGQREDVTDTDPLVR